MKEAGRGRLKAGRGICDEEWMASGLRRQEWECLKEVEMGMVDGDKKGLRKQKGNYVKKTGRGVDEGGSNGNG